MIKAIESECSPGWKQKQDLKAVLHSERILLENKYTMSWHSVSKNKGALVAFSAHVKVSGKEFHHSLLGMALVSAGCRCCFTLVGCSTERGELHKLSHCCCDRTGSMTMWIVLNEFCFASRAVLDKTILYLPESVRLPENVCSFTSVIRSHPVKRQD